MTWIDTALNAYKNYASYFLFEVTHPHLRNYFYWLILISLAVYALELLWPWRKNQARLRKDFFLDAFYMFFNFFLFSLVGFASVSEVAVEAFSSFLALFGVVNTVAIKVNSLPIWGQLLCMFLVRDFIHFQVHRLLHRVPILWKFHKVHHSVTEMGFAAHLRYHWMENVVYRTLEYLPLALIGFGIDDFILVHLTAVTIGHLNHANIRLPIGPLKYIFNNPQMHIWHHVSELPTSHPNGINFGISLSIWDYIFGTAWQPHSGRDLALGFPNIEQFPQTFLGQAIYPLGSKTQGQPPTEGVKSN